MIMRLYSYISGSQVVLESIFDTGHIANVVSATLGQWSRNRGATAPQCSQRGPCPLKTIIEGYNIIIIMPLSTKAVIQVHKDPLHEYQL